MAQKEILITREGLTKWEAELQELTTVKRPEVAQKISGAREVGGPENNADYDEAKRQQAFVEGRILELQNMIKQAKVIDAACSRDKVTLGCAVLIRNQDGKIEQFSIVGRAEADPLNGKISNESPVGKALLGRKAGQRVEVPTPAGLLKLEILQIS